MVQYSWKNKILQIIAYWIDDGLKWNTNTEYIIKKAAKRLYFLKILKSYNAPKDDLKSFIPEPTARSAVPGVSPGRGY
jgi:hypothetical protein